MDGRIAVGSIENVTDGVGLGILRPQGLLFVSRVFFCVGGEARGGHTTGPVSASADLRLVIGDPVADFELHHLALAVRTIERSEEHTSELQSPNHIVSRLLLQKKNRRDRQRPAAFFTKT